MYNGILCVCKNFVNVYVKAWCNCMIQRRKDMNILRFYPNQNNSNISLNIFVVSMWKNQATHILRNTKKKKKRKKFPRNPTRIETLLNVLFTLILIKCPPRKQKRQIIIDWFHYLFLVYSRDFFPSIFYNYAVTIVRTAFCLVSDDR